MPAGHPPQWIVVNEGFFTIGARISGAGAHRVPAPRQVPPPGFSAALSKGGLRQKADKIRRLFSRKSESLSLAQAGVIRPKFTEDSNAA
jgi:hypothetical protein